jgi:hypothetical protein
MASSKKQTLDSLWPDGMIRGPENLSHTDGAVFSKEEAFPAFWHTEPLQVAFIPSATDAHAYKV